MQRAKTLTRLLKQFADLVSEEAEQNPAFAGKLDAILAPLPAAPKSKKLGTATKSVPDVYAELQRRGEEEFRFWLAGLDIPTLKSIVKVNGFDPAKQSSRWSEPDKFVPLIVEQLGARLKRGSAFITPRSTGSSSPSGSTGPTS